MILVLLDRILPDLIVSFFLYRPFTPPTSALTSLQSSLSSVNNVTTSGIAAGVDPSYSPNSPSHLPTSTVKIKSGKHGNENNSHFLQWNIDGKKRSNYYLHFNRSILNFLLLDGANPGLTIIKACQLGRIFQCNMQLCI